MWPIYEDVFKNRIESAGLFGLLSPNEFLTNKWQYQVSDFIVVIPLSSARVILVKRLHYRAWLSVWPLNQKLNEMKSLLAVWMHANNHMTEK